MKILYLEHQIPNFLADLLYKGLCEELGASSVVDHPWKFLYHGISYEGEGRVTAPFRWMPAADPREAAWPQSDESVADKIASFDLVVLASPREQNVLALQRIIDRVGRGALRRFVIVDGEDYTSVRWDLVERFRPDVYFKLSMVPEHLVFELYPELKVRLAPHTKVVAFPLACPTKPLEPVSKDIDVSFLGGSHWHPASLRKEGVEWRGPSATQYRAALIDRLSKEFPSFVGSVANIEYDKFMSLLNRSKVAVCVGGHGIEPFRTYEILSCPETLLCRERIPVIAPHPLVEGIHCAMFDTGDGFDHEEIVSKIRYYLDHDQVRIEVAQAGNALAQEHYTLKARVRQLLGEVF